MILTIRDVHRSRGRIYADVVGAGTHISHPLGGHLLQHLNFVMGMDA